MTPNHLIQRLRQLPVDVNIEERGTVAQIKDGEWEALAIILDSLAGGQPKTLEAALVKLRAFCQRTNIPAEYIPKMWRDGRVYICRGMFITLPEDADGSWQKLT